MKRKKTFRSLTAILGLGLLFGLFGCGEDSSGENATVQVVIPEYEINTYSTTRIQRGSIQPLLKLKLTPDSYEVKTYVTQKEDLEVAALYIEKGQCVKAGDIMVKFKNDDIEKHIKEYEERKEEDGILIEHFKKLQKLEGKKKYKREIKELEADREIADSYIKEQKELLESYEIRAEREGVVTLIHEDLYKGFAAFGIPVIKVASGSSNYTTSTKDSFLFAVGDIYKATLNDVVYEMKVLEVQKEGDTQHIVFEPVSDMAGITESDILDMEIEKPSIDDTLYVEKEAILTVDEKQYVFVLDELGYREAVEVTVEDVIDGYAIISSGIEEGEQVTLQ